MHTDTQRNDSTSTLGVEHGTGLEPALNSSGAGEAP